MTFQKNGEKKNNKFYQNLTEEQLRIYVWLRNQGLNVDDDTLNYWARKYKTQRLVDVVKFAQARCAEGHQIRNVGGWIHKLLKDESPVVNDECQDNRRFVKEYATLNGWKSLHIYEKYIKDESTGDDLSLTISSKEFKLALENLYRRSKLYGHSG